MVQSAFYIQLITVKQVDGTEVVFNLKDHLALIGYGNLKFYDYVNGEYMNK